MMIKKFTQYNESIKNLLVGPTENEIIKSFDNKDPNDLLKYSYNNNLKRGIEIALEKGADCYGNDLYKLSKIIKILEPITNDKVNKIIKDLNPNDLLQLSIWINNKDGIKLSLEKGSDSYLTNTQILGAITKIGKLPEDEIQKIISKFEPNDLLKKSCEVNLEQGIYYSLENGATTTGKEPHIIELFKKSIIEKNMRLFSLILKSGIDINSNNGLYLRITTKLNNYPLTRILLDRGANPNMYKKPWEFPLWIVLRSDLNPDIFKLLINRGADINVKWGLDRLENVAIEYGNVEILKILVDNGVNLKTWGCGRSMEETFRKNDHQTIIFLLQNNCEFSSYDVISYLNRIGATKDELNIKNFKISDKEYRTYILNLINKYKTN